MLRSLLVFSLFLIFASGAQAAKDDLKIQLFAEESTGVFYDRDTLDSQTPLLFTARIENPAAQQRQVTVTWQINDAAGKTIWERGAKFDIEAGDSIVRRQLFDAPQRGGFVLDVNAFAKQKGPDTTAKASLPFAVLSASAVNTNYARPQSFFVLGTPALLSERDLDFYQRIGAHVLRSPLPPDPLKPDWNAVEAQLGARLKRNLASIAVLPLGNGGGNEAMFARQVPSMLSRYGSLSAWELTGDLAPADVDAWSQLARARRSDVMLLGPVPDGLRADLPANATLKMRALDGVTFRWPDLGAHPAALRRLWLSRAQSAQKAGVTRIHLRRETAIPAQNPLQAAGHLSGDFISAVMAGAASLSEPLDPPAQNGDAYAMARGAAFAMLTRTLEDAAFREELFPNSPALEGALFRAPRGSIAALWSPMGSGKLMARVSPARAYDIFGNPVAADKKGVLEIPIAGQPIYILADVPTDVLAFALRGAKSEGLEPLAAQILPISRRPGVEAPGEAPAIRVRLQNVGLGAQRGQIKLNPPSGWKLARDRYDFEVGEGQSKTYEFRVAKWTATADDVYSMNVSAGRQSWKQDVTVATATNVPRGESIALDGDLREWDDASWMRVGGREGVAAKVALKWDANRLFIAAQVRESSVAARRADETSYEFWKEHDALQIAFGLSNGPETVPGREPFRDSDRGFLLAPFHQTGPTDFEGRILKLWAPDKPYGTLRDHIRWGGAIPGAICTIRRDEKAGITNYEARLPLSAIPELQTLALANKDDVVRFGWLLHNNEGAALDWGVGAGNFSWWDNTATFLPEGDLTSALRATLGFTQVGDVDLGLEPTRAAPTPTVTVTNTRPVAPPVLPPPPAVSPAKPPLPATRPAPAKRPPPPEIAPFIIPPAPAPDARPLAPAPPAITPSS